MYYLFRQHNYLQRRRKTSKINIDPKHFVEVKYSRSEITIFRFNEERRFSRE